MSTPTPTKPADVETVDAEIAAAHEAENLLALEPAQAAVVNELRFVKAELRRLKKRDEDLTAEVKTMLSGFKGATILGRLIVSLTTRAGRRSVDFDVLKEYKIAYAASVKKGADVQVLNFHTGK